MGHKWLGSYEVVKNLGKGFFTLQNMESGQIIQQIHGTHLKLYFTPTCTSPHSPSYHPSTSKETNREYDDEEKSTSQCTSDDEQYDSETCPDSIPELSPPKK